MVVTIKTFQVVNRDPVTQTNIDSLSVQVNAFLSGLAAADVLDIITAYLPPGKYGSQAFAVTVVYLA